MKYEVNDNIFDTISEVLDYCIDYNYHDEDDNEFEEWVNDRYDYVDIADNRYYPFDILAEFGHLYEVLDEYRTEMNERDRDDAKYELENAVPGDEIEIQNYYVTVLEDDTGDYDGDREVRINELRKYCEDKRVAENLTKEAEKEVETDMMSLFQHIGA